MLLASAAVAWAAPPPAPAAAEKPRAVGGALLGPAESAVHVVVGRVREPRALDAQGWSARLEVERTLAGNARPGMTLRIAWEELAPSRAERFGDGERVLVALEHLPNGSLWTARFPRRNAVAVGSRGEAFAREPDAASSDALARYLALPLAQRSAAVGMGALARIAERASEPLALEALARLGALPGLAQNLGEEGRAALAALLGDARRSAALRRAALALAAQRKLRALEPEARALLRSGGPLAPAALEALGAMDALAPAEWDPLESTCRHASLSIL